MRKPFDMADRYEPLSYTDDEPTVKIQMSAVHPKFIVDEDAGDDEPTLPSMRNPFYQEHRYPGVGMMLVLGSGLLFWGFVAWLAFFR